MKNTKIIPANEIGVYKDSQGLTYESKIIGFLIQEDEDNFFSIRAISEFDLREGFLDLNENDGFIELKK